MRIMSVDQELSRYDLSIVELNALKPDDSLYTLMFMQPKEKILVSSEFIGNTDTASADAKHTKFLELAKSMDADLAMTPEYSCPWSVVEQCIGQGLLPGDGRLWVLGCEAIAPAKLHELEKRRHEVIWIHEKVSQGSATGFLDPLCYFFQARNVQGDTKNVVVVQFKGQSMADPSNHLERDNLVRGTVRYVIRKRSCQ